MKELDEVFSVAKVIQAIVSDCHQKLAIEGDPGYRTAILRNALEAIRWHVRGMFVAAYSEPSVRSQANDANRVYATERLDKELMRLGTFVKNVTRQHGPVHYPSEPFKESEVDGTNALRHGTNALNASDDAARVDKKRRLR